MRTRFSKGIVSVLVMLGMVVSLTVPAFAKDFDDVSNSDWFYPAVDYMSDNGYMVGTSGKNFSPDSTLSRAMFVTVLYRVSGESVNNKTEKFTDVPKDTWYTDAVAWALENGITGGTSSTTFSPNNPVTREQMATFIKRYVDSKSISLKDESANITANTICPPDIMQVAPSADLDNSSGWAKDAVRFACSHRFLLTDKSGNSNPRTNATRTDAVVAFYNLLHLVNRDICGCNHNWEHHDAVTEQKVWTTTEEVCVGSKEMAWYKCKNCGAYYDGPNAYDEFDKHGLETWHGGCVMGTKKTPIYETKEVEHTETVVVTPAYDVCTICGARK